MPTLAEKNAFLKADLRDALEWLFVGAVVWHAASDKPERCCHQKPLGMFSVFIQARALYEFYCKKERTLDDARALDFCDSWTPPNSSLYRDYVQKGKPLNKRVFHLVYGRSKPAYAGGPGDVDPSHVNQQVLLFARELQQITETFSKCVKPHFVNLVDSALENALKEARNVADYFEICSPL